MCEIILGLGFLFVGYDAFTATGLPLVLNVKLTGIAGKILGTLCLIAGTGLVTLGIWNLLIAFS